MKGGGGPDADDKYTIPAFEPANNPMIPIEQKRIFAQNMSHKPPFKPPQNEPILNVQLYQPPKPKPKPNSNPNQYAHPNPAVFYPNYVPNPFDPVGFANYMYHSQYGAPHGGISGPIFKEYNINIGGVSGSHVKTSHIFEDALPIKDIRGTYASLGERTMLREYIRSILFSRGDGKDLAIDDDNYNLLSHLKFMDMNPYNASRFHRSPYRGLPYGFLLFRSCYPIKHDGRNATTMCAKNSTGVNVRIYRMTEGAYRVNTDKQNMTDHDMWRDISFYEYITDQIVKKKVCPNFVIMYGYNITLDSKIDFETIVTKQNKARNANHGQTNQTIHATPFTARQLNAERIAQNRKNKDDMRMSGLVTRESKHGEAGYPLATPASTINDPKTVPICDDKRINVRERTRQSIVIEQTQKQIDDELKAYRGKALVCLTEAPNYSLMGWARKEYRADGNIKRMINTGYHPKHVWESILFQLMAALYTMQIKGIVITDFNLERNVFIKDIESQNKAMTYWKYKIDGIDYYIPNYGYIVLIDTNYRDFDKDIDCNDEDSSTRIRKIDGLMLKTKLSSGEIVSKIFSSFKSAIDPDIFGQDFVNNDGIKPPESIISLMASIKSAADKGQSVHISDYIRIYMTMFLHNRLGTLLTVDEMPNIAYGAERKFGDGELVVMPDNNNKVRFVICVKTTNNHCLIITRDRLDNKANIIEKNVPISSLEKFSTIASDAPKQSFDADGAALNTEPAETYTISRF